MTSIIILTYNQSKFTKMCIESIYANTHDPYEIIVVDNGSRDETPVWLAEQVRAEHIQCAILNDSNRGVAAGWNQGIKMADAKTDFYAILNNDVIVSEGWLSRLISCAGNARDRGVVGPVTNYSSGPQAMQTVNGYTLDTFQLFARDWAKAHDKERLFCSRLVGFCMLIKAEIVRKVVLFDERFGRGNFEDDDYCRRVEKAGYRNTIAVDCFVHHFGSVSWEPGALGAQLEKNTKIYNEKWGNA